MEFQNRPCHRLAGTDLDEAEEGETVSICGVEMSIADALEIWSQQQKTGASLNDIINDYIMTNPVTLSLQTDH